MQWKQLLPPLLIYHSFVCKRVREFSIFSPHRDLQNYMVWRFAMNMVVGLSRPYRDTRKAFRKVHCQDPDIRYTPTHTNSEFYRWILIYICTWTHLQRFEQGNMLTMSMVTYKCFCRYNFYSGLEVMDQPNDIAVPKHAASMVKRILCCSFLLLTGRYKLIISFFHVYNGLILNLFLI